MYVGESRLPVAVVVSIIVFIFLVLVSSGDECGHAPSTSVTLLSLEHVVGGVRRVDWADTGVVLVSTTRAASNAVGDASPRVPGVFVAALLVATVVSGFAVVLWTWRKT